jgi:hypothetical protein
MTVPDDSDQLTRDDLAGMTPEAIVKASDAGRCDTLLGVPADDIDVIGRARGDEPLSRTDLAHLRRIGRHDLIVGAYDRGNITTTEENQ